MPGRSLRLRGMHISRHRGHAGSIAITDISDGSLGAEIAEEDEKQQCEKPTSHDGKSSELALAAMPPMR